MLLLLLSSCLTPESRLPQDEPVSWQIRGLFTRLHYHNEFDRQSLPRAKRAMSNPGHAFK